MILKKAPLKLMHKQLMQDIKKMVDYYQMQKIGIPVRVIGKVDSILKSESYEQAQELYRRAVNSMELEALVLWGKGQIDGPLTPENLEAQARKAEGFCRLHQRKGNEKVAKQQHEKAEQLRQRAQLLRQQKGK